MPLAFAHLPSAMQRRAWSWALAASHPLRWTTDSSWPSVPLCAAAEALAGPDVLPALGALARRLEAP